MRDWRFRVFLVLLLLFLGYKFAVFGIWPTHAELPGRRYFSGHVSEAEIYAGAINVAFDDRDYSIVYLKDRTNESNGNTGQKNLSAIVENLARRPLRPILFQDREVAPTRAPIRHVATDKGLHRKDRRIINKGFYISVGHIRYSWPNTVRISVSSSPGRGVYRYIDYLVIMFQGRLIFLPISEDVT